MTIDDSILASAYAQMPRRDPRDVLAEQANLQERMLAQLEKIAHRLDLIQQRVEQMATASGGVSSVEIEQNSKSTSLTVKHYAETGAVALTDTGDAALDEFCRLRRELDARQMNSWRATIDTIDDITATPGIP